jgi:mevalonate kinase
VTAFGRGKVILLGEHGVVYGRPALACGIERGVRAEAYPSQVSQLVIPTWDLKVAADDSAEEPLGRAFDSLLSVYEERPTLTVVADVSLPAGAGLGCSAALGVAVLGAMDDAMGIERSAVERADASLSWERVFHGTPSGVDSTMASVGGIAVFQKGEPLERVTPKRPLTLVIGNTGEASSTKEMVDSVRRQHEKKTEKIEGVFDAIAAIVRNGQLAITAGDLSAFGQLMDLNQGLLSSLLLSTTRIEALCRAARDAGALGAKLTGAGGGGCMIALVENEEEATAVHHAIASMAEDSFIVEVGK